MSKSNKKQVLSLLYAIKENKAKLEAIRYAESDYRRWFIS